MSGFVTAPLFLYILFLKQGFVSVFFSVWDAKCRIRLLECHLYQDNLNWMNENFESTTLYILPTDNLRG